MSSRKSTAGVLLALVALIALAVTATSSASSAKQEAEAGIKVAVVTDVGGLNDKGFNALAAKGLADAKTQLGVTGPRLHLEDRQPTTSRTCRPPRARAPTS